MIGCGSHSNHVHGPSYRKYAAQNSFVKLSACCDINAEAAAKYAADFGFTNFYTNYMEMLKIEKPDMVCIILPINLTEKITVDVLKSGFHAIIEKPPALTPEGVLNIKDTQEKASKQLKVCFNRRYTPLIRYVVDKIKQSGENIQAIHYEMHRYRRGNEEFSPTAIHGVDLVKHIAGSDYKKLRFDYIPMTNNKQTGNHIYLSGTSENGSVLRLAFLPLAAADRECVSVHTNSTSFFVELPFTKFDKEGSIRVIEHGKEVDVSGLNIAALDGFEYFERNGFYNCSAAFLDDLRDAKNHSEGLIDSTLQSVIVAKCIKEKCETYENKIYS